MKKTLNECEAFTRVYGKDFVRKRLEKNLEKVYTDIENNKKLKHMILHESIHAIFRRTKEECKTYGIEDGTGVLEFYKNNQEFGRGFNEGLTEWICQKSGYGEHAYVSEKNIMKILELAIGENGVMQLAKGDIKGNIAELLQMSKVECL